MAIIGIDQITYKVPDVANAFRFFEDFGLQPAAGRADAFSLPDRSQVILAGATDLRVLHCGLNGYGVSEIVWGVDSKSALDGLLQNFDPPIVQSDDGVHRFLTPFGLRMGLRLFDRCSVVSAPDQLNAPGHLRRVNQHRRWLKRARPKSIGHVVYAIPDFEAAADFMRTKLGFRLSDTQQGVGIYLRADGTSSHHTFFLLNASAPLPEMDGTLKFHHTNFVVDDVDEIMTGANHMVRQGWEKSHVGLGRHRVDSALFYYMPCPAGGEVEYGADSDSIDDNWVPRHFDDPLFAYASFVHNVPPHLMRPPQWRFHYIDQD